MLSGDKEQRTDAVKQQTEYHTPAVSEATDEKSCRNEKIIASLVNDVIMPVITLCTGGIDFTNWFIALDGNHYNTLQDAVAAKAATLNYGTFLTEVINFIIMAFIIFMMVKMMNSLSRKVKKPQEKEDAAQATKDRKSVV